MAKKLTEEKREEKVRADQLHADGQATARGGQCGSCGSDLRTTIRGLLCNNPHCPAYGYGPIGGEPD